MDDVILNCILGVCCPAGSAQQLTALSHYMADELGCSPDEAKPFAAWVLNTFDLAEKGTLAPLRDSMVRLARMPRPA